MKTLTYSLIRICAVIVLGAALQYMGGTLNVIAVATNGGRMPVWCFTKHIRDELIICQEVFGCGHSILTAATHNILLCDLIPTYRYYGEDGWHFAIMSIGDGIQYLGCTLMCLGPGWEIAYRLHRRKKSKVRKPNNGRIFMREWAKKLFSNSQEASFGRLAAALILLFGLGWGTYLIIVKRAMPNLSGIGTTAAALYGASKAGDTIQQFTGKQ